MKKLTAYLLVFAIIPTLFFCTQKANAYMGIFDISSDPGVTISSGMGTSGIFAGLGKDIAKSTRDTITKTLLVASKMAALLAVQKITQAIIGNGGGGVITDWNNYLYVSPQQAAMAQMNTFFNTVSRGRYSTLNYEGVGPNYDGYLIAQARQAIAGQPFSTNLQEFATDPTQLFAGGNMKGIMTYMQCANNVACYTLTSQSQYAIELAKATRIAEMTQKDGFLPVKKNGKITQPAAIVANALTQIDQLGTQVIMNADAPNSEALTGAEVQVATGASINIAARSLNYALSDSTGKAAIQNKNDQFPFSLGYSFNGGVGLSAGGITVNTGAASLSLQTMIGNTCASLGGSLDSGGAIVTVQGKKYNCATKTEVTGTGPSLTVSLPTYNCLGKIGSETCSFIFGTGYTCSPATSRCVK